MACLFRRIFSEFRDAPLRRFIAYATFDFRDMQRIILEEITSYKALPEYIKHRKLLRRASSDPYPPSGADAKQSSLEVQLGNERKGQVSSAESATAGVALFEV